MGKPVSEDQRSRSWQSKAQTCAQTGESEMRPAFARLKPEQLTTVHAYFFSPSFPLYVSFAKRFLCCHRFLPPSLARSWVPGAARTPAPPEQRGQDARIPDPRSRARRGWEPAGGMVISSLLPRLSPFYHDTGDTCSSSRTLRFQARLCTGLPEHRGGAGPRCRGTSPARTGIRDVTPGCRSAIPRAPPVLGLHPRLGQPLSGDTGHGEEG